MKHKATMKKHARKVPVPKKMHKKTLQQWLAPKLVKKPKKQGRRVLKQGAVKPTYQCGKGVVLGLLGGLISLIADLTVCAYTGRTISTTAQISERNMTTNN